MRLLGCLAFLVLSGWAVAADRDKPSRTVIGDNPWVYAPAPPAPKVIYGTDDRIDLYEEIDAERRTWAASTCGLMSRNRLVENIDGTYTIQTSAYDVCPDEPFSNQPTSPFCTGFIVGTDLIATAGHCYDSGDLSGTRFVFGFVMEDADTPALTVPGSHVYTGVELVAQELSGNLDYAVIRVDRDIDVPGAVPFEIRRDGVIADGAAVGVIGHPTGLPLKLAFGPTTAVRDNSNPGYFVANLDTYGGNSGSPVINPLTDVVEGILVRGETDFVADGDCLVSNVVGNSEGRGEDVSKSVTFAEFVPLLIDTDGDLRLDRNSYRCADTMLVTLQDSDLAGTGTAMVAVASESGDLETLGLIESAMPGEFVNEIVIRDGEPVPGDGELQVVENDAITVTYHDLMHREGAPDDVVATAAIDCTPPVASDVIVSLASSRFVVINFSTNEPASGSVRAGLVCGEPTSTAAFTQSMSHTVTVLNLEPLTRYYVDIVLTDEAGNSGTADNGGDCFTFETAETVDYLTEAFGADRPIDLERLNILFTPDGEGGYTVCGDEITALPVDSAGATTLLFSDDSTSPVALGGGAALTFGGAVYETIHVNSNGNITFLDGDTAYGTSIEEHFDVPRVSPYFCDLDPSVRGQVWYRQLGDRIAVTWAGISRYQQSATNTFQVELFFDGRICFSYLDVAGVNAFVGLSFGFGLMPDFTSSNFSSVASCSVSEERYHRADINQDFAIGLQELLRIIQFLNLGGYHCDETGEDGYNPGPGVEDCTPHDIDYNPQDWDVNLTEALRLVQFFNSDGYAYAPGEGTEDGFRPVVGN